MYYEETIIAGVLHSRSTPDGKWEPVGLERMTGLLLAARGRIKELETINEPA